MPLTAVGLTFSVKPTFHIYKPEKDLLFKILYGIVKRDVAKGTDPPPIIQNGDNTL